MDHLMLQLQNGRMLADFSQTEIENLKSYASKKITGLTRELGTEHPYTRVDEPFLGDEIPKAKDVAPELEPCFRPMGRGSVYLMDKWFLDNPKVQKHGDGTHMSSQFNLNMEPYDDDKKYMESDEGESNKSGGADNA
ncbi:AGAMOUS-like 96 [Raphanus sativus]|nr:AGAMOUS-like 96 [Raphanus sativus]